MERQIDKKGLIAVYAPLAIIIIFHLVGYFGFTIPTLIPYFKILVPFHLLLMFSIIIYSYKFRSKNFWLFLAGTYMFGYLIEVLGVYTGEVFGAYQYGNTLGLKVANVPLLIGVNWFILIFSIGQVMQHLKIKNTFLASLIGAFLLILIDFFIEPVAIKFDYWNWDLGFIPIQNFIAWYIISFILLNFYFACKITLQKYTGTVMYFTQLLFFILLYLNT